MTAYYNEYDPFAAAWLRNLIQAGHIAPGEVDERDIRDVRSGELLGFTQVHFFAGVGIWSHALRRSGWSDARHVWTGSCPCQPFSAAGKGAGFDDERHLWPAFHHLIRVTRPPVVLGEQVASPDGLAWLELVSSDMEAEGYAVGAADLCAAGFAAPGITGSMGGAHIRQRLYWGARRVADADGRNAGAERQQPSGEHGLVAAHSGPVERLGNPDDAGPQGRDGGELRERAGERPSWASGTLGRMADSVLPERPGGARGVLGSGEAGGRVEGTGTATGHSDAERLADAVPTGRPQGRPESGNGQAAGSGAVGGVADANQQGGSGRGVQGPGEGVGEGSGASRERSEGLRQDHLVDWLPCRDGVWRPVESGTFPLAHEDTARVGRLRAYGNALDAATAQAFVEAWMECAP